MSYVFRKPFFRSRRRLFPFGLAGPQTVAPASVTASFVVTAATLVLGAITVAPASVTASYSVTTPTIVFGQLTVAPASVTAIYSVPAPVLVKGAISVTPASVTATYAVTTPTIIKNLSLTLTAVTASYSVTLPTVVGGALAIQPAAVTAAFNVATPVLVKGVRTVPGDPVTASYVVTLPALVVPGITVAPAPVVANFVIPIPVKVGDRFIVGIGATGAWAGKDNQIATIASLGPTVWTFIIPKPGYTLWIKGRAEHYKWDGASWDSVVGLTSITIITTSYTAASKHLIRVDDDTASGIVTISLPPIAVASKIPYEIKKLGTTANVVIDPDGAETVDDSLTQTITAQYDSLTVVPGTSINWDVI